MIRDVNLLRKLSVPGKVNWLKVPVASLICRRLIIYSVHSQVWQLGAGCEWGLMLWGPQECCCRLTPVQHRWSSKGRSQRREKKQTVGRSITFHYKSNWVGECCQVNEPNLLHVFFFFFVIIVWNFVCQSECLRERSEKKKQSFSL